MKNSIIGRCISAWVAVIFVSGCGVSQTASPFNTTNARAVLVDPISIGSIVHTTKNITLGNTPYLLSLENDGVTDFQVTADTQYKPASCSMESLGTLSVNVPSNNGAEVAAGWVANLPKGALINGSQPFGRGAQNLMSFYNYWQAGSVGCFRVFGASGPWYTMSPGYAGLRFTRNGRIHFGWAHFAGIDIACNFVRKLCSLEATLVDYAYQTIPGKSILAGQQ